MTASLPVPRVPLPNSRASASSASAFYLAAISSVIRFFLGRSAAPGTMKSYGGLGPDRILAAVAIRAVSAMVSAQTRS